MHLIKYKCYIQHPPVKGCRDAGCLRGRVQIRTQSLWALATFTYLTWQCNRNTFRFYNPKRLISNVDEHSWGRRNTASRQMIKSTKKILYAENGTFYCSGGKKKTSCCALQLHFITCEMKELIATMMTGVLQRQPGLSSWAGVEPTAGETQVCRRPGAAGGNKKK